MRKIIFLTLVMILGISSVSFGKSNLCISDVGTGLQYKKNKWKTEKYLVKRFIVKTNYYEKWIKDAENYKDEDQKVKNKIEKKNGLENYCF